MPPRVEAAALAARLAGWLTATRRAEVHALCPGVVARCARLGDYMIIDESLGRGHGLLLIAEAATGDIVFLAEWTPHEEASLIATPEVMAALRRDLDGVTATATVH